MPHYKSGGLYVPAGRNVATVARPHTRDLGMSLNCPNNQGANTMTGTPMKFDNGLKNEQHEEIDGIIIELSSIALRIEGLGRHRSYSLAVTKIDEARHWMRDRKHRAE
jgi:hypothetical protein